MTPRLKILASAGVSLLVAVIAWQAGAWLVVLGGTVATVMLTWLSAVWGNDRPPGTRRRVASLESDLAVVDAEPIAPTAVARRGATLLAEVDDTDRSPAMAAWMRDLQAVMVASGYQHVEPEDVEAFARVIRAVRSVPESVSA